MLKFILNLPRHTIPILHKISEPKNEYEWISGAPRRTDPMKDENMSVGKTINQWIRKYIGDGKRHFTSAIVVAAGSGSRAGQPIPKQFCLLDGVPVIVRTLQAFENAEYIREVVLAAREEDLPQYELFREQYQLKKLVRVVPGGKTRQESVLAAFEAISPKAEYVAIHDGARCLVTPEIIGEVCHAAYLFGSAIACEKVTDTLKAEKDGFIAGTLDRSAVRAAQTPQVFRADIYRAAAYTAKEKGTNATDDASLVSLCGFKVRLVDCSPENMKITNPEDFAVASAILSYRNQEDNKAGKKS